MVVIIMHNRYKLKKRGHRSAKDFKKAQAIQNKNHRIFLLSHYGQKLLQILNKK